MRRTMASKITPTHAEVLRRVEEQGREAVAAEMGLNAETLRNYLCDGLPTKWRKWVAINWMGSSLATVEPEYVTIADLRRERREAERQQLAAATQPSTQPRQATKPEPLPKPLDKAEMRRRFHAYLEQRGCISLGQFLTAVGINWRRLTDSGNLGYQSELVRRWDERLTKWLPPGGFRREIGDKLISVEYRTLPVDQGADVTHPLSPPKVYHDPSLATWRKRPKGSGGGRP